MGHEGSHVLSLARALLHPHPQLPPLFQESNRNQPHANGQLLVQGKSTSPQSIFNCVKPGGKRRWRWRRRHRHRHRYHYCGCFQIEFPMESDPWARLTVPVNHQRNPGVDFQSETSAVIRGYGFFWGGGLFCLFVFLSQS